MSARRARDFSPHDIATSEEMRRPSSAERSATVACASSSWTNIAGSRRIASTMSASRPRTIARCDP